MSTDLSSALPGTAHDLSARRSPLHERLAPLATAWQELHGYRVCMRVRHAHAAAAPWLADLSHLPRIGFKGRATSAWLASQGLSLPAAPNQWRRDVSGTVVARLAAQDFLITEDLDGAAGVAQTLGERWHSAPPRGVYLLPRQHGLVTIALGGAAANDVLARLCAVDLGPTAFAEHAIAQTQVALSSAIVMRAPGAKGAGYRLLVDTSLALYLWDVLHDVVAALGGGVLGAAQVPREQGHQGS